MEPKLTFDQLIRWAFKAGIEISFYTQPNIFAEDFFGVRFNYQDRHLIIVESDFDRLLECIYHRRRQIFSDLQCPEWEATE